MRRELLLIVLLAGCGKPAEETAPAPAQKPVVTANAFGSSTIAGQVVFKGEAPRAGQIRMSADPFCEASHGGNVPSEEVLVNDDGTLRNVFVYVKEGVTGSYDAPKEPAVLDQRGCIYRPRVQGLMVRQPLSILNSDDTLHNVHCLSDKNTSFNLGQPVRGMETKKVFSEPEIMMRFKCDVHNWMTAYVGVLEHPFFAVTGEGGAFQIGKLPAGDYVVEAWHERLGAQQQRVTVADAEMKTIAFEFAP